MSKNEQREYSKLTSTNKDIVSKGEYQMFALNKTNYILLAIGIGIVMLGFGLMTGGGSQDPSQFSEEIFSTRRITIAPITVLIGYLFTIYAIMKKT